MSTPPLLEGAATVAAVPSISHPGHWYCHIEVKREFRNGGFDEPPKGFGWYAVVDDFGRLAEVQLPEASHA